MAATGRSAVCYVILFIFPVLFAGKSPTLNDVLTALEKMVSFYKSSHRDMNLDGIYGLRVLEGQILVLLMEYEKGRHQQLPLSTVARLHMLHQRARNVSEWSLPYLARQDREYYNKLRPLVEKPFMVAHEYRRVDLTLKWRQTEQQRREVTFDEEFSDRCMGELMGTNQSHGRVCSVSPQCLDIMFVRGLMEYQITHQLIYTMLAEQEGCDVVLNQWLKEHGWPGGLAQVQLEFCSNNLVEMQDQMAPLEGYIIPIYQDLLMEQLFVCPALGYMEFLHNDWLKQILTWQKPLGCFGRMPVSEFGRNYKNRHHLDYQYEGETKEKEKNSQLAETNESVLQKSNREKTFKAKASMATNSESAVIQQSNRLRMVGGGSTNVSVTNSQQMAIQMKPAGKPLRKPAVLSQKINTKNSHVQKRNTARHRRVAGPPTTIDKSQKLRRNFNQWANKMRTDTAVNNGEFIKNSRTNVVKGASNAGRINRESVLFNMRNGKPLIHDPHIIGQRRLLVERPLSNDCLSHKTAVASGALSQFLRFLVNPGSASYQSDVSLEGRNIILNPQTDSEYKENTPDRDVGIVRANDQQPYQRDLVQEMSQDHHLLRKKDLALNSDFQQNRGGNVLDIEHHVVIRPHPDDVIHGQVMENQGDEDNPPQDYYDPDGDNEDPENYDTEVHRNDLPKLSLKVNPKFRHDFRIDTFDRRENQGDEEYEQYVDDEEDEEDDRRRMSHPKVRKLDLLNPKRPGDKHAPRRIVIDVPAGETAREANHDEDTYSYYDENNDEEHDHLNHRRDGSRVKLAAPHIRHTKRASRSEQTSAAAVVEPGGKQLSHPGSTPPGKIYMVLFCVMLAMLVLMYRFVKKRRIVIRYHRNGCR